MKGLNGNLNDPSHRASKGASLKLQPSVIVDETSLRLYCYPASSISGMATEVVWPKMIVCRFTFDIRINFE